jgi:hypothetical protein
LALQNVLVTTDIFVSFVWFNGALTQFWPYGAKIEKNDLCYNLKATPEVKTTFPAGAKRCKDYVIRTHLVAFYDHAGLNIGYNFDAST